MIDESLNVNRELYFVDCLGFLYTVNNNNLVCVIMWRDNRFVIFS